MAEFIAVSGGLPGSVAPQPGGSPYLIERRMLLLEPFLSLRVLDQRLELGELKLGAEHPGISGIVALGQGCRGGREDGGCREDHLGQPRPLDPIALPEERGQQWLDVRCPGIPPVGDA